MINRDLSFKPSLMAFCNTAEVLDKAVFKGWIRMDENHPLSRGILFDTPRGSMAVLWDRTEGNILTHPNGDIFPEPWVSSWKKETNIAKQCSRGHLTECHRTKTDSAYYR